MVGKTRRDRVRNVDIKESFGFSSVLNEIEAAQLQWLGHLEGMGE